ncbi:unnamed protein product [Candida verbasci]|uniref:Imidazole glycerol phosphate synthase hisHF n=1 Tax=Candida verbasci TaxID=1227364 RepID=A0A9W4TZ37_9ASCO|nr:unnamed protein product [Candida verbasci]
MSLVHIIDVESGNLQSLSNAILKIDSNYQIKFIHNESEFIKYNSEIEKLIFPGVGNFGHFVHELNNRKLSKHIKEYIESGRSIMGICVGLQSFFKISEESGSQVHGLGLLDLDLFKFNPNDDIFIEKGIKKSVPHIGWNSIEDIVINGKVENEKSIHGINTQNKYYFVHSYAGIIKNSEIESKIKAYESKGWNFAIGKYGSEKFVAAISKDNLVATQFHPEKSGIVGLKIIKNFLNGEKYPEIDAKNELKKGTECTLSGLSRRIIACLDVRTNDDGDLVVTKGDQYDVREKTDSSVRNLGKPIELATKYYNQGADEIVFLNITSFRNSPIKDLPMLEVLKKSAQTIFVPLTVGGGIKDMIDPQTGNLVPAVRIADLYFKAGADKVSIGSDAVLIAEEYYRNGKKGTGKSSIETISKTFGNQAVVISVDPKRKYISDPNETTQQVIKIENPDEFGPNDEQYCYYQVTSQGGRKIHELGALELCIACEALGAGEILLNSIDFDGSNNGFNLQLLKQIKTNVGIPVIASSGAGNPKHFEDVFKQDFNIDAALGAGMFHRQEYTVNDVKKYLQDNSRMDVRLSEDIEL